MNRPPPADRFPPTERLPAWVERCGVWLCFLWGVAEATVFFVVPDLGIGAVALFGLRRGLRAATAALAGACLGGALLYAFAAQSGPVLLPSFDRIPAISATMIDTVDGELDRVGPRAVVFGPLTGKPYKLYAANSGAYRRGLASFLLWTLPARGLRFFLAAFAFAGVAFLARRWNWFGTRGLLALYALFWITVYVLYLAFVAN